MTMNVIKDNVVIDSIPRMVSERDAHQLITLVDMLVILLAQPDADTAIDGMHTTMQIVSDIAHRIVGDC